MTHSESRPFKYPEPVHIVIVKDQRGFYNPMSAAWVMFTSIDPPMLAVSVGFERHTYSLLEQSDNFVIALPSESMVEEVRFFGTESGRDLDKLKALGTPTQPASEIDNVLLTDATANYECRMTGKLITGDHVIFAGEIVASHVNQDGVKRLYSIEPRVFGGMVPKSGT